MEAQAEPGTRRTFVVPIGPQHPALKEPGHFEITVEGEIVTAAEARLGYVHRGIEKGVEKHNWAQGMYMLERVCGICSHVHATAYALGAEKVAGVTVPARAQAIRVLVAELERDPQPPAVARGCRARGGLRHPVHVLMARPRDGHGPARVADGQPGQLLGQRAGRREVRRRGQAVEMPSEGSRLPRGAHALLHECRHHGRDAARADTRRRPDVHRTGREPWRRGTDRPCLWRPARRARRQPLRGLYGVSGSDGASIIAAI